MRGIFRIWIRIFRIFLVTVREAACFEGSIGYELSSAIFSGLKVETNWGWKGPLFPPQPGWGGLLF